MAGFPALAASTPRHQAHVVNNISGAGTMAVTDRINVVSIASAYDLKLPACADCAGLLFSFTTTGAGQNVDLQDDNKSENYESVNLGDTTGDDAIYLLLYSDGRKWWQIAKVMAP